MLKVLAAVAIAMVVTSAGTAEAATIRETLESFDFFGTWALNCDKPPSPANNLRSAFVAPSGDAMFTESLGPDSEPNAYVIEQASRENADTLLLRTKLNGEAEQDLTMRVEKGKVRTMSNRAVGDGKYLVRDGVATANGRETPWLTHCPEKK